MAKINFEKKKLGIIPEKNCRLDALWHNQTIARPTTSQNVVAGVSVDHEENRSIRISKINERWSA